MWSIDPQLKAALVNLRRVKSMKPDGGSDSIAYADWREKIGQALLLVADAVRSHDEKGSIRAEAAAAFEEASRIRQIIEGHFID